MSDIDRRRAARILNEVKLDAIATAQPESFPYLTGAAPGVASLFRRAGAALALLPSDANAPIAAIATDLAVPGIRAAGTAQDIRVIPMWVETADIRPFLPSNEGAAELIGRAWKAAGRAPDFARPATFDPRAAFQQLRDVLTERGLLQARIGLDMDFWPVADFHTLREILPEPDFVDGSEALARIRIVKSPREIALLRLAGEIAEEGMRVSLAAAEPGVTRDALAVAWREGVSAALARRPGVRMDSAWEYISMGPTPWGGAEPLRDGDVVKYDVGCVIGGYSSDSGRTFVHGRPRARTQEIFAALQAGFEAGFALLKPGTAWSQVHAAATEAIRSHGLEGFSRGHFGHGLGQGLFAEVWPFLSKGYDLELEPGMTLAFETPFYVDGEGGFIIEDQMVITASGAEPVWTLDRGLLPIG